MSLAFLLRERLFPSGWSIRWDDLVEQAAGTPFSVNPLAREVVVD